MEFACCFARMIDHLYPRWMCGQVQVKTWQEGLRSIDYSETYRLAIHWRPASSIPAVLVCSCVLFKSDRRVFAAGGQSRIVSIMLLAEQLVKKKVWLMQGRSLFSAASLSRSLPNPGMSPVHGDPVPFDDCIYMGHFPWNIYPDYY